MASGVLLQLFLPVLGDIHLIECSLWALPTRTEEFPEFQISRRFLSKFEISKNENPEIDPEKIPEPKTTSLGEARPLG
jgi:hypothetical protein